MILREIKKKFVNINAQYKWHNNVVEKKLSCNIFSIAL